MCIDYNISAKVVNSLLKLIDHEQDKVFIEFIKYFYNFIYNSGIKINDKFLLYIVQNAYQFVLQKEKNESKLGIYNTNNIPGIEGNFTIIKIINDDMPFLVDSVIADIKSHNLTICYYSNSIINVKRKDRVICEICSLEDKSGSVRESIIYIIIKGISNNFITILTESLQKTLKSVSAAVDDWQLMQDRLDHVICYNKDFLNWLKDNNFIFLGYQEYVINDNGKLLLNSEKNLGIFRVDRAYQNVLISSEDSDSLYVIRSDLISVVHRRTYTNCIGIKEIDDEGKLIREKRFFGLFTSLAETQDIRTIPIIKDKVKLIEKKAGFVIGGYNNKGLISTLQMFSRDELFQSSEDELLKVCIAVMFLMIRPRVKLFLRNMESFVNCIVLIPLRYASAKSIFNIRDILKEEVNAESSDIYNHRIINEYDLIKLHIILKAKPIYDLDNEVLRIESRLMNVTEKWEARFIENLYSNFNTVEDVFVRYCNLFPASYRETFEPHHAYYDMKKLEIVRKKNTSEVDLRLVNNNLHYQLKVYTPNKNGLELSQILEVTKNLGTKILSHNGYYIKINGGIWIHNFLLARVDELVNNITLKEQFEITLTKVFRQEIKNDYFNSLIILASLKWKEVLLIRTLSAYLKQVSFSYNQEYIERVVAEYPKIVKYLIQLFRVRFNPNIDIDRVQTTNIFKKKIEDLLKSISNISHDIIIRSIFNLIMAIVRTNYYQDNKPYLSIKFDSRKINSLPEPHPYRELYVYSNFFEGIHLRGGKLARGGLRWSDRTEDFRTEILGLMKAQMTKNAIIVPVGAKGGFVVKNSYKDKNILMAQAIECYKNFMRGMLDITDNIVNGKIVPPKDVIRYDRDDPYLVVAADKGTASFSDYANQIASEYNFWLGDAFASGGSAGYDHKKMGITARGAWIAAQRHFWKMGRDIYQTVTVIGIGDMSGDLFGNGMLLSRHIRLIGAFNHNHIFIDPSPDQEKSFAERQRLFELQFSSWMDYSNELISRGGGVFERSVKYIDISPEMKKCFNIKEDLLSPSELIKYLLKTKVDFIWNGGIGTFVKATHESHNEVGDKANDSLRVNGKDIRASMFIEGGNLGCTQLGRIEYANKGGYINADFIDNAAGVACSDLEVNIKIAFISAIKKKKISLKERNEILCSMIGEVASKILNDHNSIETKALLIESMQAKEKLEKHHRLLLYLEKSRVLNRSIEFLPTDEEIVKMSKGLHPPQLAVLTSYTRTDIKNKIINSDLSKKDFVVNDYLLNYFPKRMISEFEYYILKHPLSVEIISTCIANDVVNRMGCVFIHNLVENTGISVDKAMTIYILVNRLYNLSVLWKEIDKLDGVVSVDTYLRIVRSIQKFIGRVSFWLVRNLNKFCLTEIIKLHDTVKALSENLIQVLDERSLKAYHNELEDLLRLHIDEILAKKIASLHILTYTLDIIAVSEQTLMSTLEVSKIYFELQALLKFDVIRKAANQMKKNSLSYWNRRAISTALDDLSDHYSNLTIKVIKFIDNVSGKQLVKSWACHSKKYIEQYNRFLSEVITTKFDLSKLISITRMIRSLLYKENV
ncbi:glutamate dehydrogenase [Wolbachia pipientis]|uniref:Glutamate dehydrogenase n=1 Tax=Wolbachia pipientis TaxID=955 RepID=A0A1E7QJD6_WOLPI|nr:NAD-glutamate dehydrogenase domain-containing protein [Wolbachia pipientis]OEY86575.1 glutamate dehydrogenase [Wolbachia pipientis]